MSFQGDEFKLYLPHSRVVSLAYDFWLANCHKPAIPMAEFVPSVRALVHRCVCIREDLHSCGRRNAVSLVPELFGGLVNGFSLSVEANSSSLGRSPLFKEWCSPDCKITLLGA